MGTLYQKLSKKYQIKAGMNSMTNQRNILGYSHFCTLDVYCKSLTEHTFSFHFYTHAVKKSQVGFQQNFPLSAITLHTNSLHY